eukprot:scaffold5008_cov69-Phaeocystis_antarctica.AAC.4
MLSQVTANSVCASGRTRPQPIQIETVSLPIKRDNSTRIDDAFTVAARSPRAHSPASPSRINVRSCRA